MKIIFLFNLDDNSIELGLNLRAQAYFKMVSKDKDGVYSYNKSSINLLETALVLVAAYYSYGAILPILSNI